MKKQDFPFWEVLFLMLRRIEPERIICYNTPFPEMEGNIVFVDYELSFWKYQEKEYELSPYAKYITGELPLPENSGIIIKRGCLISTDKGMGSAYGAQWKPNPNKPNDMALKGTANTVQRIYISTRKGGYWIQVKYGEDGWAVAIRHETEHTHNGQHSNLHDHYPVAYDPYTHAPDWKSTPESNYWGTVPEFKDCVKRGAEIVIEWKGVEYGIFWDHASKRHYIGHDSPDTNVYYDTPDELLEYRLGNDRLRDVITQVFVNERTF